VARVLGFNTDNLVADTYPQKSQTDHYLKV